MKRLNLKLLIILVCCFVFGAIGTHFLHGYQVNKNAERLQVRAQRAHEEKNYEEEVRLLRRYVHYRKDDVDALKSLLKAMRNHVIEKNDRREFYRLVDRVGKAVRRNPDDRELLEEFADLTLKVGRTTDTVASLQQLDAMNALQPKHEVMWAVCLNLEDRTEKAIGRLSKVVGFDALNETFDAEKATDTSELQAYTILEQIYRKTSSPGDYRMSTLILNEMVEQNKTSSDARIHRARFYKDTMHRKPEHKDLFFADAAESLNLAPEDEKAMLMAAYARFLARDYETSANILQNALKLHPDTSEVYWRLSLCYAAMNQMDDSISILQDGLKRAAVKSDPLIRWMLADRQIDAKQLDEAKNSIIKIRDEAKIRFEFVNFLEARIDIANGNHSKALDPLKALVQVNQPIPFVSQRAKSLLIHCSRVLGRDDVANTLQEEQIQNLDEVTADNQIRKAEILRREGKYDEAARTLASAVNESLPTEDQLRMLISLFMIETEKQNRRPVAERIWNRVDEVAKRIVGNKSFQASSELEKQFFRIEVLIQKGQTSEARGIVEQLSQRFPKVLRVWTVLNRLTNDNEYALANLRRMKDNYGDGLAVRKLSAPRIAAINAPDVVEQLDGLLVGIDALTDAEKIDLKMVVAEEFSKIRNKDRAIGLLKEVEAEAPSNIKVVERMFDIGYATGDQPLMDEMIQKYASMLGDESPEACIAKAKKLLWQVNRKIVGIDQIAQIRNLLEKASETRPGWLALLEVRADAYLLENNYERAIETLKLAYAKDRSSLKYVRKIADILSLQGKVAEAQQWVALLPKDMRSTEDVIREIQIRVRHDPEGALSQWRALMPKDSPRATDWLLLSNIQEAAKKFTDALTSAQKATELEPERSQVWLRYVYLLHKYQQSDELKQRAIRDIQTKLTDERRMPLVVGQCYALMNQYEDAKKWYRQAYQVDNENSVVMRNIAQLALQTGDLTTGQTFLDHIVSLTNSDNPEVKKNQFWARREKAKLLTSTQSFDDFQQAVELLEQNKNDRNELVGNDLEMWLSMHANRPEISSREKALKKLEALNSQRKLTPVENVLQAQLYKASGKWTDAKSIIRRALTAQPKNTFLMTTYIRWLIDERERDASAMGEAANWVNRLHPGSSEAIQYSSLIMVLKGKSRDAAKKLLSIVPKDLPKEQASNIRGVAVMFNDFGKYDPDFYKLADAQWRRYLKMVPTATMEYIQFLLNLPGQSGLSKGVTGSDKLVARAITTKDWDKVLQYVSINIAGLQAHENELPTNSPHFATVGNWIDSLQAANATDEATIIWHRISLAHLQKNKQQVEELYRKYWDLPLADTPKIQRGIIGNNFAYLLATDGRGDEAIEIIDEAIKLLGNRSDLRDTKAMAFIASAKYGDAIRELQAIVDSGEGSAQVMFHLALAQNKAGNTTDAIDSINKSIEQGLTSSDLSDQEAPMFKDLLRNLGIVVPTSTN